VLYKEILISFSNEKEYSIDTLKRLINSDPIGDDRTSIYYSLPFDLIGLTTTTAEKEEE